MTVSEGVVPGTAVAAITVVPSNREVPGAKKISPLPDPTTPGPAGQDAVLLGSGETDMLFTNASEPVPVRVGLRQPDGTAAVPGWPVHQRLDREWRHHDRDVHQRPAG